ncbi:hypothetical protein A1O1_04750 [Capronia coronata CBS 617.96]|uniref:Uncharacterized protein n=1 Tax=Capronia coronata CBS 617.96 TaxID=1182541 RepID=W9Y5L9_9EURO|nr:uncharacterized protein A1O1_04750 [Capronia coronata CBS 617.96]EXJ87823.1 hypothetical protein A1O1_04750 [Capronia coronata CBS 617.96]
MRRCFEHTQLRRSFHCCHLAARFTPQLLRSRRTSPKTEHVVQDALPGLNTRSISSSARSPSQHISPTAWPDDSSRVLTNEVEPGVAQETGIDPSDAQHTGPGHWVSLLEQFLPKELRRAEKHESPITSQNGSDFSRLLEILTAAKSSAEVDLLGVMVLSQRRYKAAMHLVEVLLNPLSAVPSVPAEEHLPSNIIWPAESLSKRLRQPVELDHELHIDKRVALALMRASRSAVNETDRESVLENVWPFLAKLVIASTKCPPEEAKDLMSTVHQILARMHSLDLVPSAVYSYALPQGTTTVQRPPILNLLNSRILSSLSDAVWRAQQDDAIAQALKDGTSFREVSHHPPGGRFRLRVRELGPEVWLEFILWCCIENGLTSAGTRIINMLQEDSESRWSAVHWTAGHAMDNKTPPIDWDRVKRRHGGPVGQREAYSGDQPFVEMPHRTISAEVVLALIECLINSLDARLSSVSSSVEDVAGTIGQLVSFLEPHGLSPAYFDYLTVRFLQTEAVGTQGGPDTLRNWGLILAHLRSLETVKPQTRSRANFDYDAITERSELQAGVLHQALQVYIGLNLVTKAVDTFTDIQKLVDASKLETIGEFLSLTIRPRHGFFTSQPRGQVDFANSHGQLPIYKLAPFLKMVANAKLFGLGDWLLFSEDVDGPLIPFSAYRQPSIAIAVCRYAAAKEDPSLIQSILLVRRDSRRRLTVNLLRALVTFHITARDWDTTVYLLRELRSAEGGGYSPSIIAHLAAAILRLETEPPNAGRDSHLAQATGLLQDILEGHYNPSASDFRIAQKAGFKRQTGLLLRFLENVPDSEVPAISDRFRRLFPLSNEALLTTDTFNILLSAVVDTRGALEGRRMWDMFCKYQTSYDGNDGTTEHDQSLAESSSNTGRSASDRISWGGNAFAASPALSTGHTLSSAVVGRPSDAGMDARSEEIPFDEPDTGEEGSSTDPIVAPNMRTLQIIVRGALAEIQAGSGVSREVYEELDQLLQWARPLFKAFKLSDEDIELELRIPGSLPAAFARRSRHIKRQKRRQRVQEKNRPSVGSQFTNGALMPRPAVRRRQKQPTVSK